MLNSSVIQSLMQIRVAWFFKGLVCLTLVALILSGCSHPLPTPQAVQPPVDPARAAQEALLNQAQSLAHQGAYQQSNEVLKTLRLPDLSAENRWTVLRLLASNYLALEEPQAALDVIERGKRLFPAPTATQNYQRAEDRAQAFLLLGNREAALQERFYQTQLVIRMEDHRLAQEQLWALLNTFSRQERATLLAQEPKPELRGWMALAQLHQEAGQNLALFEQRLAQWQAEFPRHPAARNWPEPVQVLAEVSQDKVLHLGVFLPESGPLAGPASALRHAIIASHLAASQSGQPLPRLSFYDTETADIDRLYEQALSAGVQVVIGPLDKATVVLLEARQRLPLPTLALNYGNETVITNPDLFQFGLSAENEARQVALKAWEKGLRSALTLTPEGEWGRRIERSFIEAWEALGGQINGRAQFVEHTSLDRTLRELLEVNLSTERHQRLTRLLGVRLQFEPSPRADSDFLFLHAGGNMARQVVPAFRFLRADRIQILATSSVYSGIPDPAQDQDLNGILFCDINWYLHPEPSPLYQALNEAWAQDQQRYGRLYAMGADAYLLAQRLEALRNLPDLKIEGATGLLTQVQQRIERHLAWAVFVEGQPQPLEAH